MMCIYLKKNAAKFRHDLIWNNEAIDLFSEDGRPNMNQPKIPLMWTWPPQFQSHLSVDIRLMKNRSQYKISATKSYKPLCY